MNIAPREQQDAETARKLIEAAGGLEASAELAEISKTQLGRYQSKTERDSMPLRVIRALQAVTHGLAGHPVVTRYLARCDGYALVKLPDTPADRSNILQLAAKAAQERGDADSQMMSALADGQVDRVEAGTLLPLMRRRVETDAQILIELEAIAEGGVS